MMMKKFSGFSWNEKLDFIGACEDKELVLCIFVSLDLGIFRIKHCLFHVFLQ